MKKRNRPPGRMFPSEIASAASVGVAEAINAAADQADTPDGWVHFCLTAALEAHDAVLEGARIEAENKHRAELENRDVDTPAWTREVSDEELDEDNKADALQAAKVAFRCCLPTVSNRNSVRALIACVATGAARGYLDAKDANLLLYASQAALSAYPKRKTTKVRKVQTK